MFKISDLTKRIICLCLALTLAFALIGCSTKEDEEKTSSDPSVSSDVSSNPNDESEETSEVEYTEDTADNGDLETEESGDYWEEEEDDDDFGYDWVVPLKVYNGGAPVIDSYRGMSATVYHAFGFMKDDKSGRAYTDEMLELEIDRLQRMGVRTCRTKVNTPWLWDETTNNWNLDSVRANYMYDYCKELQSRDMNIVMQLGWDVEFVIEVINGGQDAQKETKYLDGRGEDVNGESVGYDFTGLDEYWTRVTKGGLRFGYLYKNLLNELKARGIYNVDYLMFFTEPSNRNADGSYNIPEGPGPSAEAYTKLCRIIKDYLVDADVLDGILTMGGAQGGNSDQLLRYILKTDPNLFEIQACHTYPSSTYITDNTYHDYAYEYFDRVMGAMKQYGVFGKKEYWCDEFSARDDAANSNRMQPDEDPWYGLQGVVAAIAAQASGVNNIITWQAADQLWTDQTNTGGEFIDGIHMCGAMPSLFISDVPRGEYYMWGLFSKYNGYKNGKVYSTNYIGEYVYENNQGEKITNTLDVLSGLHLGVVQLENGGWTITVVNADSIEDRQFQIDFEKALGGVTLYRHTENVYTCKRNTGAIIADVDKVFVGVEGKLKDSIPAGTVAVYTTEKG